MRNNDPFAVSLRHGRMSIRFVATAWRRGVTLSTGLRMGAWLLLPLLTGCNLTEAAVDGVYGGVSDTIAGTISITLLTLLGVNGA